MTFQASFRSSSRALPRVPYSLSCYHLPNLPKRQFTEGFPMAKLRGSDQPPNAVLSAYLKLGRLSQSTGYNLQYQYIAPSLSMRQNVPIAWVVCAASVISYLSVSATLGIPLSWLGGGVSSHLEARRCRPSISYICIHTCAHILIF